MFGLVGGVFVRDRILLCLYTPLYVCMPTDNHTKTNTYSCNILVCVSIDNTIQHGLPSFPSDLFMMHLLNLL